MRLVVDSAMTSHRGNPGWLITVVTLLIEEIHAWLRSTNREHLLRGRRTIITFDRLFSHSVLVPLFEESEVVLILTSVVLFRKLKHLGVFLVVDFHGSNQRHRTDLWPSLTQNLASMALLR